MHNIYWAIKQFIFLCTLEQRRWTVKGNYQFYKGCTAAYGGGLRITRFLQYCTVGNIGLRFWKVWHKRWFCSAILILTLNYPWWVQQCWRAMLVQWPAFQNSVTTLSANTLVPFNENKDIKETDPFFFFFHTAYKATKRQTNIFVS